MAWRTPPALEWETPAGHSLAARLWLPEGSAPFGGFPLVAAFHGLTLDHGVFEDLAPLLVESGVALAGVDFRGHGLSGGDLADTTLQAQAQDALWALQSLARDPRFNREKTGILAFSMGAVPVVEALRAGAGRPAALGLWAPLLNTTEWAQRRLRGFERTEDGDILFWKGKRVTPDLFQQAPRLDPRPWLDRDRRPHLLIHGGRDHNQLPTESHRLARRRRSMDLPVESFFPPQSGHLFQFTQEREQMLEFTRQFFLKHLRGRG